MRTAIVLGLMLIAFVAGIETAGRIQFFRGSRFLGGPSKRYELHNSGHPGYVLRFDRVTGQLDLICPSGPMIGTAASR